VILAYHGIADVDPRHDPDRLFVAPDRFRSQVETLLARGYELVAMAEFAKRLTAGPPRDTCALTFDDGTLDMLERLLPILRDLGVPGTIYACPGLLGRPYPWADAAADVRLMTADELRELAGDPLIEVGSHTREHVDLDTATPDSALEEMTESKRELEEIVGDPVLSFAYPRCLYSPACPSAAERAGYTSAVTCSGRGDWSPYTLRREMIHTPDGRLTFAFKARGLFHATRDLPPVRLARWATRPYRHRGERSDAAR
jgi:peptidoglycan/xylan/chitin deacetylase (PgdA/CDA1 family)